MVQPARLSGRSVQKQNRSYRITRYGGAPARSRATTSLLVVLAIVCCAVAACLKSKRTTLAEKPLHVEATLDEESKEGPDDELSASRHAKPIKPVEAVPEKMRAVSFDIEQPVANPLTESRASASKWSLAKP